jgi:hypothetical protein
MQTPDDKLDISSISFDDMIGDGLETVPQDVEENKPDDVEVDKETVMKELDDESYRDEDETDEYYEDGEEDAEDDVALEDLPIAEQISETLGIELEYDYDDTVQGLTNFVRDMSQEVAEDQLQGLFDEYPEVQRHLDFVMAGGDPEQFYASHNPQSDYNNIQISEGDISLQRAMLGEYFQAMGHPDDFIIESLNDFEESGKLYGKSIAAQKQLVIAQEEQREALYDQQLEHQEEQAAQNAEFWEDVADTIEDGNEFAGIRIPDNDKQEFYNYISDPIDDYGNTQRDLDYAEADMDIKLAIDYLMYSGFNLGDIIDTKARTKSVEGLRARIQGNEDRVKSARKAQRRQKTFDPDELDINALF